MNTFFLTIMNIRLAFYLLFLAPTLAFSQISVDFPFERVVYQRNTANVGVVNFVGTYISPVTSVEVRLLYANTNNVFLNWTVVDAAPQNGVFRGVINNLAPGWYKAEVRGLQLNGSYSATYTVQKFGVGEVFIIAGQSNAQGVGFGVGATGATDDRVNTINFSNVCSLNDPSFPVYSQLTSTSNISIYGDGPWAYGRLGDLLATNLGVPVLFFNAGIGGSTISNWYESMQGFPTTSLYTCGQYCQNVGSPYGILKKVIQYYIAQLGVRAILWHQGETDNYASGCGPSFPDSFTYFSKLKAIIQQSRAEINSNIPWVISNVSYNPSSSNPYPAADSNPSDDYNGIAGTRTAVIEGQNLMINDASSPFIYRGPYTDNIPRDPAIDLVHFSNNGNVNGLDQLASRWYSALIASGIFNANTQINADNVKQLNVACSNGSFLATANSGFSNYVWVANNNNITNPVIASNAAQVILPPNNTYRVYMKTAAGVTYISNNVTLPSSPVGTTPSITTPNSSIAPGNTVSVTATGCNGLVSWSVSNGTTTTTTPITQNVNPYMSVVNQTTTYTAKCTTYQGCSSSNSNVLVVSASNCPPNYDLTTNITSGTIKYESVFGIVGSNKILPSAGVTRVTYDAGKAIRLDPGFEAKAGVVFKAQIDGCGNN